MNGMEGIFGIIGIGAYTACMHGFSLNSKESSIHQFLYQKIRI